MILDGKSLANERALLLKTRVATLKAQNIIPTLLIILVGEDPASAIYVQNKVKKCAEIGIKAILEKLEANCSSEAILEVIEKANKDPKIDGIILQSPLPKQFNEQEIMQHIHSKKDVDGFGTLNLGHLLSGDEQILAATPLGIIRLLEKYDIPVASKNVLMIGRSQNRRSSLSCDATKSGCDGYDCSFKNKKFKRIYSKSRHCHICGGRTSFYHGRYD